MLQQHPFQLLPVPQALSLKGLLPQLQVRSAHLHSLQLPPPSGLRHNPHHQPHSDSHLVKHQTLSEVRPLHHLARLHLQQRTLLARHLQYNHIILLGRHLRRQTHLPVLNLIPHLLTPWETLLLIIRIRCHLVLPLVDQLYLESTEILETLRIHPSAAIARRIRVDD